MYYPICIFVVTSFVALYWVIAGVAKHESSQGCRRAAVLNKSFARGCASIQVGVLVVALSALFASDATALYVAWCYVAVTVLLMLLISALQLGWDESAH